MPGFFQGRSKRKRVPVPEARERLHADEEQKLVDMDRCPAPPSSAWSSRASSSLTRSTRSPAARAGTGPDVSREGVQRDILPIVEGTTVNTKHGMVRTDHILFIAAGAFHVSKPSDLIPELQGRFPIRVELEALGQAEFVRILTEPRSAPDQAVHGADGDRGRDARLHRRSDRAGRRVRGDASTSRPRTSARGGCTRSWSGCSTKSRSKRRSWRGNRLPLTPLRAPDARRHRAERRPVPLHPVKPSLRGRAVLFLLLVCAGRLAACGKKGPPLPPLRACRRRPTNPQAGRFGNDVYVWFTVPSANVERAVAGGHVRDRALRRHLGIPPPAVREPRRRREDWHAMRSCRLRPPPAPPAKGEPAPPSPPPTPGVYRRARRRSCGKR